MSKKWWFPILLILIVGVTIYSSISENTGAEHAESIDVRPEEGFRAPDFSLDALNSDETYRLSETDKPVVVNFWASWCGPCRLEAPDLVEMHEQYQDDVQLYAVNLTTVDDPDNAQDFVEEFGFQFPVLWDTDEGDMYDEYQVLSIPTTFFINADGIIEHKIIGYAPKDDLDHQFQQLANR